MEISDVRVKLVNDPNRRLMAVCSITLDQEFVVRDLKVVDGANGLFVAMPSRKLSTRCPGCGIKNHLRARYCNECGAQLAEQHPPADAAGRVRLHRDIAHPINSAFRQLVQGRVIEAYQEENAAAEQPGYRPDGADVDYEEEDTLEPSGERSEYDEMIAGLKGGPVGGSQSERRTDGDGSHRRQASGESGGPRKPKRGRGRQRERRETPALATASGSASEAHAVERRKADSPAAVCSEVEAPPREPVIEPKPSSHKRAIEPEPTPVSQSDTRAREEPSVPASAEVTPAQQDDDSDDTPFGAGIL